MVESWTLTARKPQGQLFLGSPCGWLSRSSPWRQSQPTSECQHNRSVDLKLEIGCTYSEIPLSEIGCTSKSYSILIYIYIHTYTLYTYIRICLICVFMCIYMATHIYIYMLSFSLCVCVRVYTCYFACLYMYMYTVCVCLTHTRQISEAKAPRESN